MTSPTAKLREMGIELPALPAPAGNYVHAVRTGRLLFLAGKGVGPYSGKVGRDVTVDQAYEYSRVSGFVNAVPEFSEHPQVINGCSDLLIEVFGERGRHARTSIGAGSTPNQIPLEIEMIVEYEDDHVA
jgi:enamine deaminase RidA (YjgF/YER057c/UK114 family)